MDSRIIISQILETRYINRATPIIIGVSGGPDSLALAHFLYQHSFSIIMAHLDHKIRRESDEDASFVQAAADSWSVPCYVKRVDVYKMAMEMKESLEEAGRKVRYQFLFELAHQHNARAVIVGHTADDQVETMLMHLLRGAGLNGLKAMPYASVLPEWDETIPLMRPLLYTWRTEVLNYCVEHGLNPRMDTSNEDNSFFRNRIRNELIPFLKTYNPNVKQALLYSNLTLKDDHDWLQQELIMAWEILKPEYEEQAVWFNRDKFLAFPSGAQRNLLRKIIALLIPHTRDISFGTVQTGLQFIEKPTQTQQVTLEQGLILRMLEKRIILSCNPAAALISQEGVLQVFSHTVEMTVPGEVQLKHGKRIFAESIPFAEVQKHPNWNNPDHAFLDRGKIVGSLSVRPAEIGERFCPLGMEGKSIKLSDFWTNNKLPREVRKNWPVLSHEDEIIWLPGFRISHAYRISAATTEVIHIWVR